MARFTMRHATGLVVAMAATALLACGCVKVASQTVATGPSAEVTALMDRAAIENLYADYYANFGGKDENFAKFYTADGVLDVNGQVATGAAEITKLYQGTSGGEDTPKPGKDPKAPPPSRFHMQFTNLKVEVNGAAAHAELFWSSLGAPSVVGETKVTEFGREQAEWVKQDGKWLMKKRTITSYGGMPKSLLKSYIVR